MATEFSTEETVLSDTDTQLQEPSQYQVILLNDDYTPMVFVVSIIMSIFHKTIEESTKIMLDVHNSGRGLVGVFPYDIATTKCEQVHIKAKSKGFPLRCSIEKV